MGTADELGPSIIVFSDKRPSAFCSGWIRPRIYLSTGAIDALSEAELRAVIAHERHHLVRRDPLRLAAARLAADAAFFVPLLRAVAERAAARAELAADAAAVAATAGDAGPLARALLVFEDAHGSGVAPERVDYLLGHGSEPPLPPALMAGAMLAGAATVAVLLRSAELTAGAPLDVTAFGEQLCVVLLATVPATAAAALSLVGRSRR